MGNIQSYLEKDPQLIAITTTMIMISGIYCYLRFNSKSAKNAKNAKILIQPKQRCIDFKIHIAIDFGTDGCALAYYYNNKVTVYNKWMTKSRQRTTKVKTQILLNDKNEVVAFGDNAKIIYSSLSGDEKRKWTFFDRFKMSLYEADIKKRKLNQNVKKTRPPIKNMPKYVAISAHSGEPRLDIVNECKKNIVSGKNLVKSVQCGPFYVKSMNGTKCKPDIVFISAFKHLKTIALEYMDKI
eukprot:13775_1